LAEVIAGLDHKFLNELECFASQPSSEKIAVHIAKALQQKLDGSPARVSRVSAWESDNACASYIP
jgi:6-pyruvoyltetrahydropterin/6-carboxytetrahydropterin synthase